MSVLIKGMDMPERGCYKCFLREGNWCSQLKVSPEEIVECARKNERHKDCPLVEVPAPTGVAIDETNFPDDNFREYVRRFDTDGNGVLSDKEIAAVTEIGCWDSEISDLTGVEHFTALTELDCSYNQLPALDVSKNAALTELHCHGNNLTELDVSQNTALTTLYCDGNQLTALDVSGCPKIVNAVENGDVIQAGNLNYYSYWEGYGKNGLWVDTAVTLITE